MPYAVCITRTKTDRTQVLGAACRNDLDINNSFIRGSFKTHDVSLDVQHRITKSVLSDTPRCVFAAVQTSFTKLQELDLLGTRKLQEMFDECILNGSSTKLRLQVLQAYV